MGIAFKPEATEEELDKLIALEEEQVRIRKENEKKEKEAKKKSVVLKDVDGEEVDQKDYFFPDVVKGTTDTAPSYFNKVFGLPVEQEELLDVFNNAFRKDKKFLFYKVQGKEIYLIIIPLKYATTISKSNESTPGDFQKHAISFIGEGSVNIESLKMKLAKVANHSSIAREPLA